MSSAHCRGKKGGHREIAMPHNYAGKRHQQWANMLELQWQAAKGDREGDGCGGGYGVVVA